MPVREPQAAIAIERLPAEDASDSYDVRYLRLDAATGRYRFATASGDGAGAVLAPDPAAGNRLRATTDTPTNAATPVQFGGRVILA